MPKEEEEETRFNYHAKSPPGSSGEGGFCRLISELFVPA
jgi:hypothetical protein